MKKAPLLILLGVLLLPLSVLAQLVIFGPSYSLEGIIGGILRAVWIIFTAFAVVMFVAAGILFLTAQGEVEKVKTARHAFIWGVVGVVVGIVAYGIIGLVQSFMS